jgi:hypothetical protein
MTDKIESDQRLGSKGSGIENPHQEGEHAMDEVVGSESHSEGTDNTIEEHNHKS